MNADNEMQWFGPFPLSHQWVNRSSELGNFSLYSAVGLTTNEH